MSTIQTLLTKHLDIWTSANTEKKSGRGRSSNNASGVYGIKKLRELILELAICGKLVPQDPKDEPACDLLKRIQAEKDALSAQGKIKNEKPLVISENKKPFVLPHGWEWTTLGSVCLINPRNNVEDNLPVSFVPMTMIGTAFNSTHNQEVRYWKEIKQGFTHFAEGDIGVAKITPCFENSKSCLFTGLLNGVGAGTTELHIVRPFKETLATRYILVYLKSPHFLQVGEKEMTGTAGQKRLPREFVETNLFPIPPQAEQHRIVAKVDELMTLCDQLETNHHNALKAHEKLVDHLLDALIQSKNAEEFNSNWQLIAKNIHTLFITESSINTLKQTLFQLGVMGKLVPQDLKDESASELLNHIQTEKVKMITANKLRSVKPLAPKIIENEKPFELPRGWEWVQLNDLLIKIGAGSTPLGGKQVYTNKGIPFLRSQNVWDDGLRLDDVAYITQDIHKKMSGTHVCPGDILFNITGASIGRCAIVPSNFTEGNVSQHVTILRLISNEILKFLHLVLISKHVQKTVMDVQVGVSREGLSIGKLGQFIIPIPPLAEQKRIVDKVKELMAFCDQLKLHIRQTNLLKHKLADAIVKQAVA